MSESLARVWPDSRGGAAVFDAMPQFDQEILPELQKLRFFRLVTDDEVDVSFAAYQECVRTGDARPLLSAWGRAAAPTRAEITGFSALIYESVAVLPRPLRRLAVLATLRAVLQAGVRFRGSLAPDFRAVLQHDFPWLEHRHLHIPPGWAPEFAFPPAFGRFLQAGSLDDARARWQLCAALNEVQQSLYSADMARRCALPELGQQSEREAELARSYFAHYSPPATRDLWRQCIVLLDALNAAVLAMTCSPRGPLIVAGAAIDSLKPSQRRQWARFAEGLAAPQWLLPARPPRGATATNRSAAR
jgi:hypothetical protein